MGHSSGDLCLRSPKKQGFGRDICLERGRIGGSCSVNLDQMEEHQGLAHEADGEKIAKEMGENH